jgi:CBS domain-containing protein
MSVGTICSRVVATASPDESVRVAARRMAEYEVGDLVVVDVDRHTRAVGVVTDRDIALRCVAANLDPDQTRIADVMTAPAHAVVETASIENAVATMAKGGTRRLVVTGDGDRVVGIVTLDDVLQVLSEQAGAIGRLVQRQTPLIPV